MNVPTVMKKEEPQLFYSGVTAMQKRRRRPMLSLSEKASTFALLRRLLHLLHTGLVR